MDLIEHKEALREYEEAMENLRKFCAVGREAGWRFDAKFWLPDHSVAFYVPLSSVYGSQLLTDYLIQLEARARTLALSLGIEHKTQM
jgi:hypothetical protein